MWQNQESNPGLSVLMAQLFSCVNDANARCFIVGPQVPGSPSEFFSIYFFFLLFILCHFHHSVFKITCSFLCHLHSAVKLVCWVFIWIIIFFISKICIWFLFISSVFCCCYCCRRFLFLLLFQAYLLLLIETFIWWLNLHFLWDNSVISILISVY